MFFSLHHSISFSRQAAMEGEKSKELLRGFFFPMLTPGHMIPLIDIAKLLSRRGVAATIVTTPGNENLARPAIDSANIDSSINIDLILLPFPPSTARLLPGNGRENLTNIPSSYYPHLVAAIASLRPSLHDLLVRRRADFLVSDAFLVWTADMAAELRIPRIVFDGPGAFPLSVHESLAPMQSHGQRFTDDDSDLDPIIVDGLHDRIELTKLEIPEIFKYPQMIESMKAAEEKSFGVVVNTFHALEPAYTDLFRRRRTGRRAWFVGPVSLSNADEIARADRGGQSHPDIARLIMSWLDAQPDRSVVYACFGSLCGLDRAQVRELAVGLESAGHGFLWAAVEWEGLPEGFEERVKGRGLVVRRWVPQVAILSHAAVGAFLTHCGWNSTLEGLAAGVPLAAWPMMHEQFINERLITDVLGVGVRVRRRRGRPETVTAEEVSAAVGRVMGDEEEAEGIRRRVRDLAESARAAMEVGGSSFEDLGRMMEEVRRVTDTAANLD